MAQRPFPPLLTRLSRSAGHAWGAGDTRSSGPRSWGASAAWAFAPGRERPSSFDSYATIVARTEARRLYAGIARRRLASRVSSASTSPHRPTTAQTVPVCPELERQRDERDAVDRRIGAEPPDQRH